MPQIDIHPTLTGKSLTVKRLICIVVPTGNLVLLEAIAQNSAPLANDDVISLHKAGISDEVVILRISSSSANFKTDTPDLVALKNAGVSDAVIAAILKASNLDETKKSAPIPPASPLPLDVQARQKMMDFAKGWPDP